MMMVIGKKRKNTTKNQVLVVHDKPGKITEGAEEDEHDSESSISSTSTISCKVSKQSTESIDKPGKITEGAEDDVLMKQGSNEYPSIPDSADDSSSLPDHLFFPVWEDSLEEVALA
jgi:hypothetical protein